MGDQSNCPTLWDRYGSCPSLYPRILVRRFYSKQVAPACQKMRSSLPFSNWRREGLLIWMKYHLNAEIWQRWVCWRFYVDCIWSHNLCDNHQGIVLLSVSSKVLCSTILNYLNSRFELVHCKNQWSFQLQIGCGEFTDLNKAYDFVSQPTLWTFWGKNSSELLHLLNGSTFNNQLF